VVSKNGVPKLVMQTWKDEDIPKAWATGQSSLLSALPADYTYVYLTDAAMYAFVAFAFPEFVEDFALMPHPIQRADILRYLWLYAYGGLYMDLDYLVLRPFHHFIEALNGPLIVLHSSNVASVLTNSLIIARPGVPLFLDLAREALKKHKTSWFSVSKHLEVMITTGPLAFDKFVRSSGMPYTVLPQKLFLPTSPMIDDHEGLNGFMKPLEGGSWNSGDSAVLNFLNKYKFFVISSLFLFLVYKLLDGFLARVLLKLVIKRMKRSQKEMQNLRSLLAKEM
jgi:mannosyltransferase OCH1-like enzyme